MKNSVRYEWLVASLCVGVLVAGCSSYYKVTEPQSGKTYYTKKVDNLAGSGAVKVKDDRTGSVVTLQSSEVKEISEKDYKAGLAAPVVAPAAASAVAPAPVVAPASAVAPAPVAAAASAVAPAPVVEPASAVAPAPATEPSGTK